jgi:multidrug efflux pump subunit AcrB
MSSACESRHDQYLIAGGTHHLRGAIAKNGILIFEFANMLQESGLEKIAALHQALSTGLRSMRMTSATDAGSGVC